MVRSGSADRIVRPLAAAVTTFVVIFALRAVAAAMPAEGQKTFASPQAAVAGLIAAVKADSEAELLAILGPDSEDLISSGDPVADKKGRTRFLKAYGNKHRIEEESPTKAVLHVGAKDYPFPIPMVQEAGVWHFDTQAGKEEILNRRIGRNELHTIEVLQAYTDAQREYACMKRQAGASPQFAQKLTSSDGREDGLYWKPMKGEEESPFGPLIAKATQEGYASGLDGEAPEPYHGYYFKILKAQGKYADGGAYNYVVKGKMILGFAMVAYPAKYGSSGIMTFIVNQEGVIYEKNLGEDTPKAAEMTTFDPDPSWKKYQEAKKE
ncbi:MAG: DUF2950 domain-containing protein [Deltaproteobacteria bacterium]|jgi:hypothetical protein